MESSLYVPLAQAIRVCSGRVSDALTALSIAEIRPSVTMTQLVDTVNELHSAVGESISMVQLFVVELNTHEAAVHASQDKISGYVLARNKAMGTDAEAYKTVTTQLLDEVRRSRLLAPPSIASGSVVVPRPISKTEPTLKALTVDKQNIHPIIKDRYKKRHANRI